METSKKKYGRNDHSSPSRQGMEILDRGEQSTHITNWNSVSGDWRTPHAENDLSKSST